MLLRTWGVRLLWVVLLGGTAAVTALWLAIVTARCEGFGCLGVGAMAAVAVALHLVCFAAGGVLLGLSWPISRASKWLLCLLALHTAPLLWLISRVALQSLR